VEATFAKGALKALDAASKVHIPKAPEVKPLKVPIGT